MDWKARRDGLLLTPTQDDLVVYDQQRHEMHYLNPLAAYIWQQADQHVDEASLLADTRHHHDDTIDAAVFQHTLAQLAEAGLITGGEAVKESLSRRRLLRRTAIGGVAMSAVVSVSAPMAAQASSTACTSPPAPSVSVTLRPSGDPIFTLFTVSISGYCPNTVYHWELWSVWGYIQDGDITTDGNGNGSVNPTPSHRCHPTKPPSEPQFFATVEGVQGWAYFPCPPEE